MEELDRIERAMEEYMGWGAKALRSECRRLKATPTAQNKASYFRASLRHVGRCASHCAHSTYSYAPTPIHLPIPSPCLSF
ncbi:hypothetical protein PHYSODRAFT_515439 [Phytophthora sojae]|uniref:Uncharacterized protein n=1 Tax=Phytophthora sojae (strain P6497) TaxID=1094619 RepID=G4ZW87_PHYSP|nr:hypothetical protein PHYSODRAFT_515439 [Phytophthora sojae]EGZ11614.1 hypothetical protein PHYSODRAFT_515439 [Phytophthora sojae]|eukprot:XP_009531947.1 hypothetical protein PHYSODRAFT_515439 [Phytophthora sojae]